MPETIYRGGFHNWACFPAQQSAERPLKGFLYSKGFRALVTYSVTDFLEKAVKLGIFLKEVINFGKGWIGAM